jgi:hypothetical protein
MVFAFAGDSTTTTFTVTLANYLYQLQGCLRVLKQGYSVARLAFQASRELKFQQDGGDDRGRQLALPDQFVNRDRAGPERLEDFGALLIGLFFYGISVG